MKRSIFIAFYILTICVQAQAAEQYPPLGMGYFSKLENLATQNACDKFTPNDCNSMPTHVLKPSNSKSIKHVRFNHNIEEIKDVSRIDSMAALNCLIETLQSFQGEVETSVQIHKKVCRDKIYEKSYPQAIQKVLYAQSLSIEAFDKLSLFKKKSLLIKISAQDYEILPLVEQKIIKRFRLEREKFNNDQKYRHMIHQRNLSTKKDLMQKDLLQNQQADTQVEA